MIDLKFDNLNRKFDDLMLDGDTDLFTHYIGIDVMEACTSLLNYIPDGDTVTLYHMLCEVSGICMSGATRLMGLMDEKQLEIIRAEAASTE